jgi:hypothetical protein
MAIIFSERYRHQGFEFLPGISLAFDDPDAEPFFKKLGLAADTADPPLRIYAQEEINIDPDTVFADGQKVSDAADDGPSALERMGTDHTIQPVDILAVSGS